MKRKLVVFGLIVLALGAMMLGGCGGPLTTSILYDSPNWMPDGRIICNKLVMTSSQQWYGPGVSESHGYFTALYPSGTGEVNLFEGAGYEITCASTGESIAYIIQNTYQGIYRGLMVSDYRGNEYMVPNTANVDYLDWSPDGTKLAYVSSHDLYVINKDGTGKILLTSEASGPISWRVGNKISYSNLYIVNFDGTNNIYLSAGRYPQNYSVTEVVYQGADGIYKINFDGTMNTRLFSNYDLYVLRLSFDNTRIVSGVYGGPGIWLINVDGTGEHQLR